MKLVSYAARIVLMTIVLMTVLQSTISSAQQSVEGIVLYTANLRAGPGLNYSVRAVLNPGPHVFVDGRNGDKRWLLIRLQDGRQGWLLTKLIQFLTPIVIRNLPVRNDIFDQDAAVSPTSAPVKGRNVTVVTDAPRYAAQITPPIRAAMKAVFARGQAMGNNPRVFTRVGDCLSGGGWFMRQFGDGSSNNLGRYAYLQNVINFFSVPPRAGIANSFVIISQAERGGFSTASVQDPEWSDPMLCGGGETPLQCEFRIDRPSVAIIMFGVTDVNYGFKIEQFSSYLNQVVKQTLDRGIIPILSTAPETPSKGRIQQFNEVVAAIARENALPLINLAGALAAFPDKGLDPDGIHLTPGLHSAQVDFSNMKDGFTVWNFLALQSLYNVWQQIIS